MNFICLVSDSIWLIREALFDNMGCSLELSACNWTQAKMLSSAKNPNAVNQDVLIVVTRPYLGNLLPVTLKASWLSKLYIEWILSSDVSGSNSST